MTSLYFARIQPLEPVFPQALDCIPPQRRDRLSRLSRPEDRLRSLAAGLLLRAVLGITQDSDLVCEANGKPVSASGFPFFSLSHSGDYAMLAVGDLPLGADLEHPRSVSHAAANRLFSAAELAWAENDPLRLLLLWTGKESVMKYTGQGLLLPGRAIVLQPDAKTASLAHNVWCWHSGVFDRHIWSLVSADEAPPVLKQLDTDVLLAPLPRSSKPEETADI